MLLNPSAQNEPYFSLQSQNLAILRGERQLHPPNMLRGLPAVAHSARDFISVLLVARAVCGLPCARQNPLVKFASKRHFPVHFLRASLVQIASRPLHFGGPLSCVGCR